MKTVWEVSTYFQGKLDKTYRFTTRGQAIDFYDSKVSACRYGLIGWSVSYPREVSA